MTKVDSSKRSNSSLTFWRDSRGLSTVEYVIVLVLIAAAAVGGWSILGQSVRGKVKASVGEMRRVTVQQ